MEPIVKREQIFNGLKNSLGNSTTVKQAVTLGLAGGAYGAYTGEGPYGIAKDVFLGAATPHIAGSLAKTAFGYVNRQVAEKVVELLTSGDPQELLRGLRIARTNPGVRNGLSAIIDRLHPAIAGGVNATGRIPVPQLPSPGTIAYGQGDQTAPFIIRQEIRSCPTTMDS